MNLSVTNVPRHVSAIWRHLEDCSTFNLWTWLQAVDLQDRVCIAHHRMDELLIKEHTVSDGQATSPIKEGAKGTQSLSSLSSSMVDMCCPGQLYTVTPRYHIGLAQCNGSLKNQTDWGLWMCLMVNTQVYWGKSPSNWCKWWFVGHGYENNVICIQYQLDMVKDCTCGM
jgi:hypothetical protein